ncbi:MAG: DUF4054 domain-containing protein [Clostridiales bacterium]|nr:DUF4054 domain-containing protein [Clostridiales bacterium]
MSSAKEIIRLMYTEFASVDDDTLDAIIALCRPLVSKVKFKGQYEWAVALVAAHKMKLQGYGDSLIDSGVTLASANGLASVSEGNTSISFDTSTTSLASTDPETAEYAKTIYGLQFLTLRRQMVMNIVIDGSGVRKWR